MTCPSLPQGSFPTLANRPGPESGDIHLSYFVTHHLSYSLRKGPLNEGDGVTGHGKANALYEGTALAGP
jgi:hypothetical protein